MKKTVSRLWSAILAFLLVTGLCPAAVFAQDPQADAPWAIDGVYQIGTADELFWFASQVNGGSSEIDAVLTGDIDLENRDWTPIGNYDNSYSCLLYTSEPVRAYPKALLYGSAGSCADGALPFAF